MALGKRALVVILVPPEAESEPRSEEYGQLFDAYWFICCFPGVRVFTVNLQSQAAQILQAAVEMRSRGRLEMDALKFARVR